MRRKGRHLASWSRDSTRRSSYVYTPSRTAYIGLATANQKESLLTIRYTAGILIPPSDYARRNAAPHRDSRSLRRACHHASYAHPPRWSPHRAAQHTSPGLRTRCRRRDLEADHRATPADGRSLRRANWYRARCMAGRCTYSIGLVSTR